MILSIAMIVKNEEKYLDKTLKSLVPLMSEIESELIIVDTGSTDRTVDIANKYTDKVYFKDWSGNFAEMRNESIKYAKGEWILILDADEEVVEYHNFIDFINSDKREKYNSLNIVLNNFSNEELTVATKSPLLRIFKNDGNFKYEGMIHEQPVYKTPIYNPVDGAILVNHYGYIYEDETIRQKKMKRNEELLFKELELNPNSPYINYQLGQNYMVLNKASDAVFHLEKSRLEYEKKGILYIPTYVSLLACYYAMHENLKAEQICLKYLKKDKRNIDIYFYLANAQKEMSRYEDSAKNYNKFFYYIKNYNESTQARDIICSFGTSIYEIKAVHDYCEILIKKEKYVDAMNLIEEMKVKYKDKEESLVKLYEVIIELLYESNNFEKILSYYEEFSKSKIGKKIFLNKLETFLYTLKEGDKEIAYRVLSQIDDNYGVLNKLRLGESIDKDRLLNILEVENDDYYGSIIVYVFNQTKNLYEILSSVNSLRLCLYLRYAFRVHRSFINVVYEYIKSETLNFDVENIRIRTILERSMLESKGLSRDRKYEIFKQYCVDRYRLFKIIYERGVDDCIILNNTENTYDYLAIKLKILDDEKESNMVKYVKEIGNLIVQYPEHKDMIEMELKSVEEYIQESKEVRNLKEEYKNIVEKNINSNNFDIAKQLLYQYEEINGVDENVLNMKGIINLIHGDLSTALDCLIKSYKINSFNYDTLYNIAFIKKELGYTKEAVDVYRCILKESKDEELVKDVKQKIEEFSV